MATVGRMLREDEVESGSPPAASSGSATPRALPRRLIGRAHAFAVGLLVGIPLLALSIAALTGYPLLTGDDVSQNYPLSVLAGEILAHGHLPVYNPYLWAGSPLLAGANAHALFPTTLLFAFLPHLGAWVLAEALTLGAAATGAFVLLRRNGCRPLAAGLGGASFGLGGFVSSQIVHVDFVAASAALIWCLVALDAIVRGSASSRAAGALLLAAAAACIGLSGSPDIVIDAVVAIAVYGGHLLIGARGRRLACVGWAAAGGLAGLAVSAVQWLPTAAFIGVSERAHPGFSFVASGSASAAELLVSLVPHLLGGGPIGLEAYTGPYSLAELDAYCGVLALVAVSALAWRWRSPKAGRWRVWYLVGGLGLLLALGAHTPVERLLVHVPLLGEQRLPSRALILVSLASSMLLAHWIEDQLASEPGVARRASVVSGLVVLGVVLGLLAATAMTGRAYGGLLDAVPGSTWSLSAVAPYIAVMTGFALAAVAIVALGPTWPRRLLKHAVVALVVADLFVFTVDQSSLAPVRVQALRTGSAMRQQLAARLSDGGRVLVVDPARLAGVALNQVGGSDLNVLSGLSSAQGYGSLVWGPYASATGTHSLDDLDPAALATGVFDSLDVRVLLTVPQELSITRVHIDVVPGGGPGTPPGLEAPPIAGVGPVRSPIQLAPGQVVSRWFGRDILVRSVTLQLSSPTRSRADLAALGRALSLVTYDGAHRTATSLGAVITLPGTRTAVVTLRQRQIFIGLETADPLGVSVRIGSVTVTSNVGSSYDLDGALSGYLTAPHWVATGMIGPFAAFANERASRPFSLAPSSPRGPLGVRVVSSSAWTPTETVSITSGRRATVVRSVADIPGWSATGLHDGHSSPIALHRDGLVQSFSVPQGRTLVTFRYDAPGLRAGLGLTGLGIVALLVLGLLSVTGRRRGRSRPGAAAAGRPSSPRT